MATWITAKEGVRYREHSTRKHGVNYDRYYVLRYRDAEGKRKEEPLGWASKEGWTTAKAVKELHKLKVNHTTGTGAQSLKDRREIKQQETAETEKRNRLEAIKNLTFADIFTEYLVHSKVKKKNTRSWKREEQLFRIHLFPVIGTSPLSTISEVPHLRKIQNNMEKAELSPRTVRYALHVIRIVYNFAIDEGLYSGANPAREESSKKISGKKAGIRYPQEDNTKNRYLSRDEADLLLQELARRSEEVRDMAMMSLYTGMRFGEIANLKWSDVDLFQGLIMLRNTKSGKNRPAYMNPDVQKMFARRGPGAPEELVFPARWTDNKPHYMISHIYYDTVKKMFNQGITDKKKWVNFHTLRHTFASWLVEQGTDIYLVKDLLGHHDLKMTERYAHIGENQLKQAVMKLQTK
jgi:integrase